MSTILVFGTFDPLHAGHEYLFREAKKLGDRLIVVVAQDENIRREKHREPRMPQADRLHAVSAVACIDNAVLGDADPSEYALLKSLAFDCIALGYDQRPSNEDVRAILHAIGKEHVRVVRLPAYKPEQYKSSLIGTS
ncbi:MAG: hypothetical protein A3E36_03755 [Candidatus Andersenbacteria bacterium RIFCSPHIGHO2_12_FULL_45_11b]|uniref:Cytidyltransferase-like domain-containing protein n=1 Tax=Candidatus Andersenbacteria bacterium RIFCSPHIGHO2_12_FULL_45_11b TaxID=1797282 RepID=A0A1G1X9P1_9BACT|nr:MAG: hypothetical protein A3E36_03755 [Candidatus Andersenbacteria bacterium RIFCSPHIGHO2_12_FULL_45_11b]